MPDTLPPMLSSAERKAAADRLWQIIAMIDAGCPTSDVREAVKFTAMCLEEPAWATKDRPVNLESNHVR